MLQKPSKFIFILFAIGQLGWSLTCFCVCNCVTYFYSPPVTNGVLEFPEYIPNPTILGIISLLGAIVLSSFIPDALSNFIVASKSDSDSGRFLGKRKKYMLIGILPFALFSILTFIPITSNSSYINAIWFTFCLFVFYISWSLYNTPYNAMINDLGHTTEDRLLINTYISVSWALGFLTGNAVYVVKDSLQAHVTKTQAFQAAVAIFAGIGFLCMLVPILFIDEKKYCKYDNNEKTKSIRATLLDAMSDKNIRFFLVSDTIYWLASNTITVCMVYYVVNLLKLEETYTTIIGLCILLGSFVMYLPINILSKRMGKKKLQSYSYVMLIISFAILFFVGWVDWPYYIQLLILAAFIIFPLASFGILPNSILSDLIEYKKQKSGEYHAAMYFSAKTVMMKLGVHVSNFILFALIPIGKGTNNIGIRSTAIVAMVSAAFGLYIFSKYNEKEVQSLLNTQSNE